MDLGYDNLKKIPELLKKAIDFGEPAVI